MLKRYKPDDQNFTQAQQIWAILSGYAEFQIDESSWGKGKVTYSDLTRRMGLNSSFARIISTRLDIIANFCKQNNLPALNVIVVSKSDGKPGHAVLLSQFNNTDDETEAVLNTNWYEIRIPSIREFREAHEAGKQRE